MKFSKWTLYQLLIILVFVVSLYFVNAFGASVAITGDTSNSGRVFKSLLTAGVLIALVVCINLIMYFQQKNYPNMLNHPIWSKMPILTFAVGFISIVLFLSLGTFGPLMEWIDHIRWLLYLLAIYFVWLFFLFVMSIIVKVKRTKAHVLDLTFGWTCIILLVTIFIF